MSKACKSSVGLILDLLSRLPSFELTLVTDDISAAEIQAVARTVPARVLPFSDRRYADVLRESDVCISPKYLMRPNTYAVTSQRPAGLLSRTRVLHAAHSGVWSGAIFARNAMASSLRRAL